MRYAPYFCEENVWHLANERAAHGDDVRAVFVTNDEQRVAMWEQRAGDPVVWDYHVVLLLPGRVLDLDTTIDGAPDIAATTWFDRSFAARTANRRSTLGAPRFRVVPARELLATFSSDRSHMRGPDGAPLQTFPPWPMIQCPLGPNTLPRYLDLDDTIAGEVLDLAAVRAQFG